MEPAKELRGKKLRGRTAKVAEVKSWKYFKPRERVGHHVKNSLAFEEEDDYDFDKSSCREWGGWKPTGNQVLMKKGNLCEARPSRREEYPEMSEKVHQGHECQIPNRRGSQPGWISELPQGMLKKESFLVSYQIWMSRSGNCKLLFLLSLVLNLVFTNWIYIFLKLLR